MGVVTIKQDKNYKTMSIGETNATYKTDQANPKKCRLCMQTLPLRDRGKGKRKMIFTFY